MRNLLFWLCCALAGVAQADTAPTAQARNWGLASATENTANTMVSRPRPAYGATAANTSSAATTVAANQSGSSVTVTKNAETRNRVLYIR